MIKIQSYRRFLAMAQLTMLNVTKHVCLMLDSTCFHHKNILWKPLTCLVRIHTHAHAHAVERDSDTISKNRLFQRSFHFIASHHLFFLQWHLFNILTNYIVHARKSQAVIKICKIFPYKCHHIRVCKYMHLCFSFILL